MSWLILSLLRATELHYRTVVFFVGSKFHSFGSLFGSEQKFFHTNIYTRGGVVYVCTQEMKMYNFCLNEKNPKKNAIH